MVRLTNLPVIVIKKELSDIPLFGLDDAALRRHPGRSIRGREGAARAGRGRQGRRWQAADRWSSIPEGTRVRVGSETPELKSGFAALYRALGLPVVPVAVDSGRLWGRGFVHRSGTVTVKVAETVPAGLSRVEIEGRVHAAINALGD